MGGCLHFVILFNCLAAKLRWIKIFIELDRSYQRLNLYFYNPAF